jgi:hypothetical protein
MASWGFTTHHLHRDGRSPSYDHHQSPRPCGWRWCAHPDAELIDLGEQIKKRLPDYYKARQISHALYEQTEYATGSSRTGALSASAQWKRASQESEYSAAFERANELYCADGFLDVAFPAAAHRRQRFDPQS